MSKKYAYGWITAVFFLVSLGLHWLFGWLAYVDDSLAHNQTPNVEQFAVQIARETFENWQSEFLQLLWQVIGLAYFLYLGSPASKEGDERLEEKVDALLKMCGGENVRKQLDEKYMRKEKK